MHFFKYCILFSCIAGLSQHAAMAASPISLGSLDAQISTTTPLRPTDSNYLNGIVAIVNNDVITRQELTEATAQTINQAKLQNIALVDNITVEQQVLQTMIMQKIALQLAALEHITVSDAELNQAVSTIASQNKMTTDQLFSKLSAQGIDQNFYINSIRTQMIIQQLEQTEVASAIMITPNQIDNYIAAQARTESTAVEYDVAHILIALPDNPTASNYAATKAKAENILHQINQGLSFTTAAQTYSASSDAASGGDLGYKTLNQLPTAFVQPLSQMNVGDVAGPIATADGFNLIKLVDEKGNLNNQPHFIKEYHIQSILLKSSPILDNAQVKAQLERISQNLANGESFSDAAKVYSEDYFTSQNGGDMGFINPAKLNPVLASYIAQAPLNVVSAPIQTPEGWYLLKVLAARDVNDSVAYQRQQADQALFQQKANEALLAWQAQIKSMSYIKILDPSLIVVNNDSGS